MAIETRFIPHALRTISEAVVAVIVMTDLHVRPDGVSKRLAVRARARIKALEQMLRRVIMLMAIGLSKSCVLRPLPGPRIRLLAGHSPMPVRARKTPKPRQSPAPCLPYRPSSGSAAEFFLLPPANPARPVNIAALIKRIQLLQRVLTNPEPQARRLAMRFARLATRRRTLPPPPPDMPLRRAPAELSLIAGALPLELARAAAQWHDTG